MFPQISRTLKELPLEVKRRCVCDINQVLIPNLFLIQLKERDLRADGTKNCGGYRLGGGNLVVFASVG